MAKKKGKGKVGKVRKVKNSVKSAKSLKKGAKSSKLKSYKAKKVRYVLQEFQQLKKYDCGVLNSYPEKTQGVINVRLNELEKRGYKISLTMGDNLISVDMPKHVVEAEIALLKKKDPSINAYYSDMIGGLVIEPMKIGEPKVEASLYKSKEPGGPSVEAGEVMHTKAVLKLTPVDQKHIVSLLNKDVIQNEQDIQDLREKMGGSSQVLDEKTLTELEKIVKEGPIKIEAKNPFAALKNRDPEIIRT